MRCCQGSRPAQAAVLEVRARAEVLRQATENPGETKRTHDWKYESEEQRVNRGKLLEDRLLR